MRQKLEGLNPYIKQLAEKFIEKCRQNGIDILIYCSYRSFEEQNKLYAQGRTTKGKIVTNAKGGQSNHNYGLAFDAVPIINGSAQWNATGLYEIMGKIWVELAPKNVWGGNWKFIDRPHFENTGGLSTKSLLAGHRPVFPSVVEQNKTQVTVLTDSYKKSVAELQKRGVITDPSHWLQEFGFKGSYVRTVINRVVGGSSFVDSLQKLTDAKLMASPDYWLNNTEYNANYVQNLFLALVKYKG